MIQGRFAGGLFRGIIARYDGNVHDAPTAQGTQMGRLFYPVPDSSIMNRQIAGFDIETNLARIRSMVDELPFPE